MSHSFYVIKPKSGAATATSVDDTSPKKNNLMHGNPKADAGLIGKFSSPKSGSVPAGG